MSRKIKSITGKLGGKKQTNNKSKLAIMTIQYKNIYTNEKWWTVFSMDEASQLQ